MNIYRTAMIVVDDLGLFNKATTAVDDLGNFVSRISILDSFFEIDFGAMNSESRQDVLVSLFSHGVLTSADFRQLSNDQSLVVLQLIKS